MASRSKDFKCSKAARKLKNIQNIFWTSENVKEIPPSTEQTQSMKVLPQHQQTQFANQVKTPAQINLLKLRQLAKNQKKHKVVEVPKPDKEATGFKIQVVDENGVKNGEFSDINHLKFETAKGGKPK